MQQGLLPLFPLPVVLFPRTPLPLHIFEQRYKEMIGEVLREGTEFGVVLYRNQGVVNFGCTAAIEKVLRKYPDGRMDIFAVGRRRFELLSLDTEKAYLRGAVEFFEDEGAELVPAELAQHAIEACRPLWGVEPGGEAPEISADDPQLSFQLAHTIEDLDFRIRFLRIRSEAQRLRDLMAFLEEYLPKHRLMENIKRVQPWNGHSRLPFTPPGNAQ